MIHGLRMTILNAIVTSARTLVRIPAGRILWRLRTRMIGRTPVSAVPIVLRGQTEQHRWIRLAVVYAFQQFH